MTVQALRAEANQRNIGTGGQRAVASKAQLVQALTSGAWPAGAVNDPAAALSAALLAMMPTPGIDEDRVRQLIREGQIRATKIKQWRILHRDLDAFIRARTNK